MNSTKEMILQKCFVLFSRRSYEAVSLENIQNEIGMSRGAIYHHFKSKNEIFKDVIDKYLFPSMSILSQVPKDQRITLKKAIESNLEYRKIFIINLRDLYSCEEDDFYYFKLLFQAGDHYEGFEERTKLINEEEFEGWLNVVVRAQENKEIKKEVDANYIAKTFMTIPLGLGLEKALYKHDKLTTNEIETMYFDFYDLIKND